MDQTSGSHPAPLSATFSPATTLQRGKACMSCRRRKLKCDGARPVCRQCNRDGTHEDCQYTSGPSRSRTQILEEHISTLEARIEELEGHGVPSSTIGLFDPYQTATSSSSSRSSSLPSLSVAQLTAFDSRTQPIQEIGTSNPPQIDQAFVDEPDLLDIFFRHAGLFGWFLHSSRFRAGILQPAHLPNPHRPMSLLLTTIRLWATFLSGIDSRDESSEREFGLVSRIRALLGGQLSGLTSPQLVQVIQARLLFATYLFTTGQLLDGRQVCDAAVSLVISCGLYRIRSEEHVRTTGTLETVSVGLPEPLDQVEEGERLNAFWTVFSLDRSWAVVLRRPTFMPDDDLAGSRIDSPWPLDMESYESGHVYPNLRTSGTLRIFLGGFNTTWPWENQSVLALLSKASALFERAARLSASWSPGSTGADNFYTDFLSLDQRIEDFKSQLLPLVPLAATSELDHVRSLHLVYCLTHAAIIQLHGTFVDQVQTSKEKCLGAALSIVRANDEAGIHDFLFINPLIAMIWSSAARVIIEEIVSLGTFSVDEEIFSNQVEQELELRNAMAELTASMTRFATSCSLMQSQLTRVQDEYAGV